MKRVIVQGTLGCLLLCFVGGCNRVVDWGTTIFDQGVDLENKAERAQRLIKSVFVYDQFTTEGMFDVLWLSDDVRMLYSDLYSMRRCKNEELRKAFLRRQLEENNHFITFYVLSPFDMQLADSQTRWSIFLKINDIFYCPIEISVVDLDFEYKAIFGKKFTRFKESYAVKFSAIDIDEKQILGSNTHNVELYFKTLNKQTKLVWNFNSHNCSTSNERLVQAHTQQNKDAA
jgi:hypothetical protein